MRFVVQPEVFDVLPDTCFGVVVARGIDNRNLNPTVGELLSRAIEDVRCRLDGANTKEVPEISAYRDAFLALGFNPNKYPCSIEALVKRILKGGDFPRISNVVDLGNSFSLKYLLPMGAHDIAASPYDIEVRYARPGDTFIPFGSSETEDVDPGELIYARGDSVKTRRWIWRQSDIGKITEDSSDIFFPIDGFTDFNRQAVLDARQELAEALEKLFGCTVTMGWVDRNAPEMAL